MRRQQYEAKTMLVILFMTTGPLLIHQVAAKTLLAAIYYRDKCLRELVKNLHKKRPTSPTNGIRLHYDNACPQLKDIILNYLSSSRKDQSDGPSAIPP